MRYDAKIDLWMKIMSYLTVAFTIGPAFLMPSGEVIIYLLFTLPINVFVLWMLYGSYLEFRDEELYIKLGPIYGRVRYDNIKSISLNRSWSSSYSLTLKRVFIKVHSKTWIKGDMQVGPINREEFIDKLTRRCKNLDES